MEILKIDKNINRGERAVPGGNGVGRAELCSLHFRHTRDIYSIFIIYP